MTVLISAGLYPRPTIAGLSVLVGIPPERIAAHLDRENSLPVEWIEEGERRKAEVRARTGDDDLHSALDYWAARDLGLRVVVLGDEVIV